MPSRFHRQWSSLSSALGDKPFRRVLQKLTMVGFCLIMWASIAISQEPSSASPEKVPGVSHLPNAIQIHREVISGGMPEEMHLLQNFNNLVSRPLSVSTAPNQTWNSQPSTACNTFIYPMDTMGSRSNVPSSWRKQSIVCQSRSTSIAIMETPQPSAAAVACISAGMVSPKVAASILAKAGTSPNYQGLHESALTAAHRLPLAKWLRSQVISQQSPTCRSWQKRWSRWNTPSTTCNNLPKPTG